jgi:hypothetical protein
LIGKDCALRAVESTSAFHKCDETIRGHVFCSFLALVLKRELEIRMEQKALAAEWAEVIRGLDPKRGVVRQLKIRHQDSLNPLALKEAYRRFRVILGARQIASRETRWL